MITTGEENTQAAEQTLGGVKRFSRQIEHEKKEDGTIR